MIHYRRVDNFVHLQPWHMEMAFLLTDFTADHQQLAYLAGQQFIPQASSGGVPLLVFELPPAKWVDDILVHELLWEAGLSRRGPVKCHYVEALPVQAAPGFRFGVILRDGVE